MQLEKITSKENAKLKAAAKLLQSKKERKAAGAFVAEGKRLCLDAFYSGQKPLRISGAPSVRHPKPAGLILCL